MSNLFTTYTYGGGDVLHAIFNVIAIKMVVGDV